jgi:hypothetical protein
MRRLVVLAALVGLLGAPTAAAAQESPPAPAQGINVTPDPASPRKSEAGTLAELGTVEPGEPIRDGVLVRSSFDVPTEVLLYAADAIPAVGGGFGFTAQNDPQTQVGRWLLLEQTRLTVPARGQVLVPYTLTVPAGTQGGEYVGAVVAEEVDQSTGPGLESSTRFAMAVYLRVPGGPAGATPGRGSPDGKVVLETLDPRFDGARACPVIRYRNDSQDILDPVATVRSDGLIGGQSYTRDRVGALLPGSSAEVALPCVKRPIGPGRLDVALTSPKGGGEDTASYTWLPWPFVLSFLLLLLLIAALVTTFLRGSLRRRSREPEAG